MEKIFFPALPLGSNARSLCRLSTTLGLLFSSQNYLFRRRAMLHCYYYYYIMLLFRLSAHMRNNWSRVIRSIFLFTGLNSRPLSEFPIFFYILVLCYNSTTMIILLLNCNFDQRSDHRSGDGASNKREGYGALAIISPGNTGAVISYKI